MGYMFWLYMFTKWKQYIISVLFRNVSRFNINFVMLITYMLSNGLDSSSKQVSKLSSSYSCQDGKNYC